MAVGKIGWGFGIAMYVFFSCIRFLPFETLVFAGLTNEMLYLIQRYTRQNTYSGCVRKMLGRKAEWFTDLIQVDLLRRTHS